MDLAYPFRSNPLRHEGVRPFNVWGLRLFYLLMLVFVAPSAWRVLLNHEGAWDPLHAVAWALWQAGTMEGASAQPIAESFLGLPLLVLVVPWGYAWRTYALGMRAATATISTHTRG